MSVRTGVKREALRARRKCGVRFLLQRDSLIVFRQHEDAVRTDQHMIDIALAIRADYSWLATHACTTYRLWRNVTFR